MAKLLVFVLLFLCLSSSIHARKLLVQSKVLPSQKASLFLAALPKGTVYPSAPSKRSHEMTVDQRLFASHVNTRDRFLQSVPSPGVGH
ncbi:precursor of CEP14 [Cinnamomum micranthum f. kanehirae]|uniref:Precursor of CEP14 n=1 Tax=Cinnamomum micranthum f. kanehirae TaxID=337451 RepID=A0A3S3QKB0_9MAGN|nr:precursor of CEP14 [Cinnamomum micranthum f. kanehirae]